MQYGGQNLTKQELRNLHAIQTKSLKVTPEVHRGLKLISVEQDKDMSYLVEMILLGWVKQFRKEEGQLEAEGNEV
jgi:hypothetical protein